jgi:hypothetical protein
MDLKPKVSGNGSLTVDSPEPIINRDGSRIELGQNVLKTNPSKKKLIQPITIICGTIMTICVRIPAIIPSMAAGSESGLGGTGVSPCFGGPSLRYVPSANALDRSCEMAW